jgi:hypothetical protein
MKALNLIQGRKALAEGQSNSFVSEDVIGSNI